MVNIPSPPYPVDIIAKDYDDARKQVRERSRVLISSIFKSIWAIYKEDTPAMPPYPFISMKNEESLGSMPDEVINESYQLSLLALIDHVLNQKRDEIGEANKRIEQLERELAEVKIDIEDHVRNYHAEKKLADRLRDKGERIAAHHVKGFYSQIDVDAWDLVLSDHRKARGL